MKGTVRIQKTLNTKVGVVLSPLDGMIISYTLDLSDKGITKAKEKAGYKHPDGREYAGDWGFEIVTMKELLDNKMKSVATTVWEE
jgi:hypothetical protein